MIYKKKIWKRIREQVLRRDEYLCQESKRFGKNIQAEHVHHIIPLEWCLKHDTSLVYNKINLTSLSKEMHDKMHDRTNGILTKKGEELIIRTFGNSGREWLDKNK